MSAVEFCYWLQGKIEIDGAGPQGTISALSIDQVAVIRDHLQMVFVHDIDPKAGGPEVQEKLNKIHNPFGSNEPGMRC